MIGWTCVCLSVGWRMCVCAFVLRLCEFSVVCFIAGAIWVGVELLLRASGLQTVRVFRLRHPHGLPLLLLGNGTRQLVCVHVCCFCVLPLLSRVCLSPAQALPLLSCALVHRPE